VFLTLKVVDEKEMEEPTTMRVQKPEPEEEGESEECQCTSQTEAPVGRSPYRLKFVEYVQAVLLGLVLPEFIFFVFG